MKRGLPWALGLVLCVLVAGVAYVIYRNAVPYQEVIDHGPSPEALSNPYLAAEQFLQQRGLKVQHADGLEILPTLESHGQTLLMLGERSNMTPRQVRQVLNWTRAGGRLVLVAEALWDEKTEKSGDLLLDRLRIHQFMSADQEHPPQPQEPEEKEDFPKLTKLYLEDEKAPAYFSFDNDFDLDDPHDLARSWANSGVATHMMQLSYGSGTVTVLTDAEIWKNTQIGRYDNAWLLWYLSTDSTVTLLFDTHHDGLWQLLLRYFPQALVALAALIGLWLWHVGVRHGPLQAPPPKARRQLREHLRASADFLLRHGGQGALLKALRLDIQRRARRRHPGFERLDTEQQCQVLARLTQQPIDAISQALPSGSGQRHSSADFSRLVAHLQTLRNAL